MDYIYYWEFIHSGITIQLASTSIGAVRVRLGFHRDKGLTNELRHLKPGFKVSQHFWPNEALAGALSSHLNGNIFNINIPWDINATPFMVAVWKAVCKIPYGQTNTYQDIALKLGNKMGSRAVGRALSKNPLMIVIPCHRVVSAKGLGGFSSGIEAKKFLIGLERINQKVTGKGEMNYAC